MVEIVDGDTVDLRIAGEVQRVRLILVDTPEVYGGAECYGAEASARARELLPVGSAVELVRDVSETDRFGRLLRYVWLPDGRMLNEVLVAEGYATLATYPPDIAEVDRIRAAQTAAQGAGRGLWTACAHVSPPSGVPTPSATAAAPTSTPTAAPPPPPRIVISAFCNRGPTTASDCSASSQGGLLASGGWTAWATFEDWKNVTLELNGQVMDQSQFSTAFARLPSGVHSLRMHEQRGTTVVSSETHLVTIVAPPNPFAEQCRQYLAAYAEAVRVRAAYEYITFLENGIARYCR